MRAVLTSWANHAAWHPAGRPAGPELPIRSGWLLFLQRTGSYSDHPVRGAAG